MAKRGSSAIKIAAKELSRLDAILAPVELEAIIDLQKRYPVATNKKGIFNVTRAIELEKGLTRVTKTVVSERASRYRLNKTLEKIEKENRPIASGFGGLSSDQAYYATGWKLTPGGFVWSRPSNSIAKEWIPPSVAYKKLRYDSIDNLAGLPLFENNLPVTADEAARMREEDRITALKKRGNDYINRQRINATKAFWLNAGGRSFRDGDIRIASLTDWKKKVFEFAESNGFGTGPRGLANAELLLKTIAKKRGVENLKRHKNDRKFKIWYDSLDEDDRHLFDLTQHYGGGREGRLAAENRIREERRENAENIHKSRRSRDRKRQNLAQRAYNLDMMSDYDRAIFELSEKYGGGRLGRQRAENVYEYRALKDLKWLGPIAKGLGISGKQLGAFNKSVGTISKIPIVGSIVKNPVLGIAALYGAYMSSYKKAIATNLNWDITQAYFGKISDKQQIAFGGAGVNFENAMKSVGNTKARLARMAVGQGIESIATAAMFGLDASILIDPTIPFDRKMQMLAERTKGMDDGQRIAALSALGVSPQELSAYNLSKTPREMWTREQLATETANRWKASRDYKKVHGNILERIGAFLYFDPILEYLATETALNEYERYHTKNLWRTGKSPYDIAVESANSIDTANAYINATPYEYRGNQFASNGTYIYVNGDVKTEADRVFDLAKDIEDKSDYGAKKEVVEAFDSRKVR